MENELTKVSQDSTRGGFFLASGTALATAILAIASILVARFLGPELYGQYSLALVAPQILYLFTDLGINQGITKFAAELRSKNQTNRIPQIIKNGLILRIIMGIAMFIANFVFAESIATGLFLRPELTFYIRLSSIFIPFQIVLTTSTSAFVGLDKTEYQAIATNVQAIAKTILSITLILAGFSITGAIIGHISSYAFAAFAGALLLWLCIHKLKISHEKGNFRQTSETLFRYGIPVYLAVLLAGFLPLFKNVVLAFFTTDVDIGNYKAALNFGQLLIVIAGPIATILLPAFSKLNATSNQKFKDFFQITNKYTTMIIIPVTFLVILFSSEIVHIIYGATYELAPIFLSTFCIVYFLVGLGYMTLPSFFNGLGKTKIAMNIGVITFVSLIFLAVPLTQAYGVEGLLIAFLISNALSTIYGAYRARKIFQVTFDVNNLVKIYLIGTLSSCIPLLLKFFLNLPDFLVLILGGIIYLFCYVTLIPLTGVITSSELKKLKLAIQNTPLLNKISAPLFNYLQRILKLKAPSKNKRA